MSTKQNTLKSKVEGRVAHVTIDHPPMNTINVDILQSLAGMVADFGGDPAVRVILLDTANNQPPFAADAEGGPVPSPVLALARRQRVPSV
jgi:enoyl-CoA hydratase/carnithine racemase